MEMQQNVLMISTVDTGYDGITSVMMNYVRRTHQIINYDFVLCGKIEGVFRDELERLGGSIFIPPCSRVRKPFTYSSWLKKIMKAKQYNAIHVHGNSGTMYIEIHAAKQMRIPIRIAHSHSTSCKYMKVHKILKPFLNRELTHGLACSDLAGKWLFTREFTILQNGIDVDKFSFSQAIRDEYRKKMGLEDKFVIGHVGYMNPEKNHKFLLSVFKKFVAEHSDARLILIGEGRLRSEINQYIAENGLNDFVQVLGKRSDVANLYQCMDVFALPSVFEGLGLVLIEAQTAGLPCIASTGVPTAANAIGKVTYLGIEASDVDRWVSYLAQLKQTSLPRVDCRDQMKNSVFNIEKCIEILLNIYKIA